MHPYTAAAHRDKQTRLPARDHYPAKVLRAFTSAKGIRRPCYVFLSPVVSRRSCEIIPANDPDRLTVAFGALRACSTRLVNMCGRRKRAWSGQETAACVAAGLLRG